MERERERERERESRHFQIFRILTKVPHIPVIKDKDGERERERERERVDTFKYF